MVIRCNLKSLLVAVAAGVVLTSAASATSLRVCTDPDNMPFSKSEGVQKGLFIDLAEMVGKRLNMPVEYVWWLTYNQRKALRNTIMNDGCDAYFALPADAEYKLRGLQRTKSFIDVSYALVAPTSFNFATITDLKGKRVGVLHGSPPHILLSRDESYTTTSFIYNEEAFAALSKNEVDVAILWGPNAGFENIKSQQGRWRVTPVTGQGFSGQMAVAVRKDNDALLAGIDKALLDLQPEINSLASKYGFPLEKPLFMAHASDAGAVATFSTVSTKAIATPVIAGQETPALPPKVLIASQSLAVPVVDAASSPDALKAGRVRFNDACSHCHGTDGFSPVSERDLRRLKGRYKDEWKNTALTTIKYGKPDAGMPTWKDVLSPKDIENVIGFLSTIQK